jgi:hypothetical protein
MECFGVEKLRGAENWSTWKFSIRNLLRGSEGAYEVCIGDLQKPKPPKKDALKDEMDKYKADVKVWDKADRYACQVIVKSVETRIMSLILTCETSYDMWQKLLTIFEQQSKQAAHIVQSEFFGFKKAEEDDMTTHISKFENLVLKMQQLNVKPEESSLIVKLLDTLPNEYESLCQAWWARSEEQQTLTKLIGVLTTDDQRRNDKKNPEALLSSNKVIFHKKNVRKEFKRGEHKKFKCYGCNKPGHIKRNCPNTKINKSVKHQMSEEREDQAFVSEISEILSSECCSNDIWVVDSGATNHVTPHRDLFETFHTLEKPLIIHLGSKSTMDAIGKGNIRFEAMINGSWNSCVMENVLYVPDARRNLFSVTAAIDKGLIFVSDKNGCEFIKNGVVKARGVRSGQLLKMCIRVKQSPEANLTTLGTLQNWHERMAHQNKSHVKKILKQNSIEFKDNEEFCGHCVEGKQHKNVYQSRTQRAAQPGEIIHADLCGPMEQSSLGGSKYFLCFTCDYTKYRMVYFVGEKSETFNKITEMVGFIKNQCGHSVKNFQCDGGLEFNNKKVSDFLKAEGIKFVITNPYTPQQNGCAERTNRTVVDLSRTLLVAGDLPKSLWAEAVNTSVYTLNRTGPSSVEGRTPYELFTGKTAHLNKLHIFGSSCYVHVPKDKRKKWDPKGLRGKFVGYSEDIDGYRILMSSNQIIRSKDVVFEPDRNIVHVNIPIIESSQNNIVENSDAENQTTEREEPSYETESLKTRLRTADSIKKPVRLIESMLAEIEEPIDYNEALKSECHVHWKAAMEQEMNCLLNNNTWTLTDLPIGRSTITNRWVYRIKRNPDGSVNKYKARLVAKGYSQRKGLDYSETFSPVARFDTIRAFLSVAAHENLKLTQFDVKSAFLHGHLDEELYMDQPQGFQDGSEKVCKLNKSLYGLKQSPRIWNKKFKDAMKNFGLLESEGDPCLFFNMDNKAKLIVVIYVDDGLVASNSEHDLEQFVSVLKDRFNMTVEPIGYFLNVSIRCNIDGSIFINQQMYTEAILKRFEMNNAKPVVTPIEKYLKMDEVDDLDLTNAPYREAVGCLMYLAVVTRPDITFAVNYVSQFLEKPTNRHWQLVKRILRYLKGTPNLGILFKRTGSSKLEIYSDADFASDPITRKSVSGMISMFNGAPISWFSKRQQCVSLSTTEAEYIAASEASKEAIWLHRIFKEISLNNDIPSLFVDNTSAIKLAKNPEFHNRTKHIDTRYHYIREMIENKNICITHVSGDLQLADILTKPATGVIFGKFIKLLGLRIVTN